MRRRQRALGRTKERKKRRSEREREEEETRERDRAERESISSASGTNKKKEEEEKLDPNLYKTSLPPPNPQKKPPPPRTQKAKNVILAGVKAVVLHDHRPTAPRDLGANFYLTPADVGRNRAEACRARLAELNVAVHVTALATEGPLAPEQLLSLEDCDVLVLTEAATADAVRLDEACRSRKKVKSDENGEISSPIAFIRADTRGVFASVFTDFGDSFVVDDVDGEEPATGIGE